MEKLPDDIVVVFTDYSLSAIDGILDGSTCGSTTTVGTMTTKSMPVIATIMMMATRLAAAICRALFAGPCC
ncbi:hypothetical protein SAY87_026050 [Trapa incisa]|uniref:Uncharacterized protein n=1 Tax=Trapa incisa TaxID=236973 RepID=A0AAN7GLI7_9MYRT|nr:hypothetical protein SAY87_026050 [Trapa incisa]